MRDFILIFLLGLLAQSTLGVALFPGDVERRLVTLEARQYADSDAFEERIRRLENHLPTQRRVEISRALEKNEPVANENAIGEKFDKLEVVLKQELADTLGKLTSKFEELVEKLTAIENKIANSPSIKTNLKIGEKYYYIEKDNEESWKEAKNSCAERKGHLATLENEEEWKALAEHLSSDNNYWIDVTDSEDEGDFQSDFKGMDAKFLKWSKGEPNNGGPEDYIEDCVELQGSAEFYMNDARCSKRNFYICEIPA
ncbi:C-type lectin domain family 3 member A [Drosophila biarmipes]|uniref:C-type lectin domain family 3 member A n=1 Tax=Drosophila biarmipes TaxID=125945 RepID=UPI0007E6A791|nr:C-type lectin domain family 3 member A [Drosophila biarmipes]